VARRRPNRHAHERPDDPHLPDLLERVERGRHESPTWGRATLNWSLHLFGR
jgi:hypothetical protein